jgi:predicted nucleic acid-binding protein
VTGQLLLDNSAWARLDSPALPQSRADEIADTISAGGVAVSLPFLLEAGYSARDAESHADLLDDLLALERFAITETVERRALDAQRHLARRGHHRPPPVVLLIAAIADSRGLGILHYDADYDRILEHTDLTFASVWLAPRGSI